MQQRYRCLKQFRSRKINASEVFPRLFYRGGFLDINIQLCPSVRDSQLIVRRCSHSLWCGGYWSLTVQWRVNDSVGSTAKMHCNFRPPTSCQLFSAVMTRLISSSKSVTYRFWLITFSLCDLDLWPFDLERLQCIGCDMIKLSTKFERNWTIRSWVIAI